MYPVPFNIRNPFIECPSPNPPCGVERQVQSAPPTYDLPSEECEAEAPARGLGAYKDQHESTRSGSGGSASSSSDGAEGEFSSNSTVVEWPCGYDGMQYGALACATQQEPMDGTLRWSDAGCLHEPIDGIGEWSNAGYLQDSYQEGCAARVPPPTFLPPGRLFAPEGKYTQHDAASAYPAPVCGAPRPAAAAAAAARHAGPSHGGVHRPTVSTRASTGLRAGPMPVGPVFPGAARAVVSAVSDAQMANATWPRLPHRNKESVWPTERNSPDVPNVGSVGHEIGMCKPCAFVTTKGCDNGAECKFCHLCDPGEKKRRRKEKLQDRRSMRQAERALGGGWGLGWKAGRPFKTLWSS